MVGSSARNMEWQNNLIPNTRPCSGDGRIPSGLGCSFRGSVYRGPMVREGTYNCLELMAGALAVRTFAKHERNV